MALEQTKLTDIVLEIEPALWIGECCIYKVPENLPKESSEAYSPQLISIGPIHHNEPKLLPMENEKRRYYCEFFRKRLEINSQKELESLNLRQSLLADAQRIKRCYSDKYNGDNNNNNNNNTSMDEFVNMILLDVIFVIELFLRNSEQLNYKEDQLFAQLFLKVGIQRDLSLLENQLPFFVFNELYDKLRLQTRGNPSFLHLAHKYFTNIDQSIPWSDESLPRSFPEPKDLKHFTHLIRCYSPGFARPSNSTHVDQICATKVTKASNSNDSYDAVHRHMNATKLNDSGVSFRKLSNKFLLDVSFEKNNLLNTFACLSCLPCVKCAKARFQIPQLTVNNNTEFILRNLVAFEQCQYPLEAYICNYIFLLNYLINTKEDVELLVEKKVIIHDLGSKDEVAALFNNLGKQVFAYGDRDCYRRLVEELNNHYNNKWNYTIAKLRSVYFCDLRGSSTVVGIAILFFTFFNFFSSVF